MCPVNEGMHSWRKIKMDSVSTEVVSNGILRHASFHPKPQNPLTSSKGIRLDTVEMSVVLDGSLAIARILSCSLRLLCSSSS